MMKMKKQIMSAAFAAASLCLLFAARVADAQTLAMDDLPMLRTVAQNSGAANLPQLPLAPPLNESLDAPAAPPSSDADRKPPVPMLSKRKSMQVRQSAAPVESERAESEPVAPSTVFTKTAQPRSAPVRRDVQPFPPGRPWGQQARTIVAPFVRIYTEDGPYGRRTVVNAPFAHVDTEQSVYGRRTVVNAPGAHVHTGQDATGSGTVVDAPGVHVRTGTPNQPPPGATRRAIRQYYRTYGW